MYIERELLLNRIQDISTITGITPLVKCYNCAYTRASLECLLCCERFCQNCLDEIHNKLNKNLEKHKIIRLIKSEEIEACEKKNSNRIIHNNNIKISNDSINCDDDQMLITWRKFEYFCFPTYKYSESYDEIEKIFKKLILLYFNENGLKQNTIDNSYKYFKIKEKDNTNDTNECNDLNKESKMIGQKNLLNAKLVTGRLINKDFDLNHEKVKAIQGDMHVESFKAIQEFLSVGTFNIEEKLFINRTAFMLFKRKGIKATLIDFHKILRCLQVIFYIHIFIILITILHFNRLDTIKYRRNMNKKMC